MIYEVEFLDNFLEVFFSNNGLFCYLRFAEICIGNLNFSIIALEHFCPQKLFIKEKTGNISKFLFQLAILILQEKCLQMCVNILE